MQKKLLGKIENFYERPVKFLALVYTLVAAGIGITAFGVYRDTRYITKRLEQGAVHKIHFKVDNKDLNKNNKLETILLYKKTPVAKIEKEKEKFSVELLTEKENFE